MSEAPNMYPNLNDQQQFRLNKINKNKDHFIAEIREKELMSKRLSKYFASFATVIGAPVGIASASFSSAFLNNSRNCKKNIC